MLTTNLTVRYLQKDQTCVTIANCELTAKKKLQWGQQQQHDNTFNSPLFRTIQVSWYQEKTITHSLLGRTPSRTLSKPFPAKSCGKVVNVNMKDYLILDRWKWVSKCSSGHLFDVITAFASSYNLLFCAPQTNIHPLNGNGISWTICKSFLPRPR